MTALITALLIACGPQPMPHVPPPNCKRMDPQCVCDQDGRNCRWEFVCTSNDRSEK